MHTFWRNDLIIKKARKKLGNALKFLAEHFRFIIILLHLTLPMPIVSGDTRLVLSSTCHTNHIPLLLLCSVVLPVQTERAFGFLIGCTMSLYTSHFSRFHSYFPFSGNLSHILQLHWSLNLVPSLLYYSLCILVCVFVAWSRSPVGGGQWLTHYWSKNGWLSLNA